MLVTEGKAKIIGKDKQPGIFSSKYTVFYEAFIEGQRVTGSRTVSFDCYSSIQNGDEIDAVFYSGNGANVTNSRIDAGLESLFAAFIHPDLRN